MDDAVKKEAQGRAVFARLAWVAWSRRMGHWPCLWGSNNQKLSSRGTTSEEPPALCQIYASLRYSLTYVMVCRPKVLTLAGCVVPTL